MKWLITIVAIIGIAAHLARPDLSIDAITLSLVIIAFLPWLGRVFKAIELPGGLKIEYHELKSTQEKAQSAGLLEPKTAKGGGPIYAFQMISGEDPNLALAGLRIEIEKRLNSIAEGYGISESASVSRLLTKLDSKGVLDNVEVSALRDMIGLLNSAVHGAKVDDRALDWALNIGPKLLASLDEKIPERQVSA